MSSTLILTKVYLLLFPPEDGGFLVTEVLDS
jgi:hypothetical protein